MDPFSRRSTWNIIRRNKKGRVILLTTVSFVATKPNYEIIEASLFLFQHFMDEADILGDRIAIMAHGNLQCVGSSLFLKNKFGVGYTLTIVKDTPVATQQTLKQMQLERSSNIKNLVCRYVPEAEPLSDVGAEQSFRLPFSSAKSFVDLFSEFDANKLSLGIAEYGVSVTTLEEVFIRVGELSVIDDANELQAAESNAHHSDDREENRTEKGEAFKLPRIDTNSAFQKPQHEYTHIGPASGRFTPIKSGRLHQKNPSLQKQPSLSFGDSGSLLGAERLSFNGTEIPKGCCEFESDSIFVKHMIALFQKRIVYAKRDTRMICCQLILPVLLVILGVSLLLVKPDLNQPDIILSPSSYNSGKAPEYKNFVPFLSFPDENGDKSIGQMMQEQFNGGDDGNGVYGVAVPINGTTFPFDAFGSCSLGAEPLYNMSQFLMLDQNDIEQGSSRYGAITIADTTNTTQLDYNIMVNGSAIHGIGVYVNLVHSSFLQVLTGNSKAAITIHNHPLPETYQQESKAASTSGFVVSLFCMIAYCFIPASFAAFVVKEREVKAKHQQIISGISIYAYWITTYVW